MSSPATAVRTQCTAVGAVDVSAVADRRVHVRGAGVRIDPRRCGHQAHEAHTVGADRLGERIFADDSVEVELVATGSGGIERIDRGRWTARPRTRPPRARASARGAGVRTALRRADSAQARDAAQPEIAVLRAAELSVGSASWLGYIVAREKRL